MRAYSNRSLYTVQLLLILTLSSLSLGQGDSSVSAPPASVRCDSGDSLAAVACRAKAQKGPRSKKVLTDDDLEPAAGPLPPLKMDGAENGDDVIAAIAEYKRTHTPEQTESAVRRWYEKYDDQLAAAIRENLEVKALRDANVASGYELCQQSQDYRYCRNRQLAEARGAQHDQAEMGANNNVTLRIQHAFMNIRNGLAQNSLRYDWFKIRTTNNVDKF
jgi:hypothetical protein